jgi:hypothetical protein
VEKVWRTTAAIQALGDMWSTKILVLYYDYCALK